MDMDCGHGHANQNQNQGGGGVVVMVVCVCVGSSGGGLVSSNQPSSLPNPKDTNGKWQMNNIQYAQ